MKDTTLISFEEIGSRLGITAEEAYRDYRRGIKKLRTFLRACPEFAYELALYLDENKSLIPRGAYRELDIEEFEEHPDNFTE